MNFSVCNDWMLSYFGFYVIFGMWVVFFFLNWKKNLHYFLSRSLFPSGEIKKTSCFCSVLYSLNNFAFLIRSYLFFFFFNKWSYLICVSCLPGSQFARRIFHMIYVHMLMCIFWSLYRNERGGDVHVCLTC